MHFYISVKAGNKGAHEELKMSCEKCNRWHDYEYKRPVACQPIVKSGFTEQRQEPVMAEADTSRLATGC